MEIQEYLKQIDKVIADGPYCDNWESLSGHPVPRWYQEGKFGIFVHWGVFSVPAFSYEWYPRHMYIPGRKEYEYHKQKFGSAKDFGYKDFIPLFKAENFNPKEWVELFQDAGARFVMPVGEHHDGFAMYASNLNRWNAANMGPKRDILRELKEETEGHGIKFCTSSHRAEHYWYFNGGRMIDSDVNDSEFEDFYGPAVYDKDLSDPFPKKTHQIDSVAPDSKYLEDWLVRTCELVDLYQPSGIYFDWWIQNLAFKPYLKKFAAYYYNKAAARGQEVTIYYKYHAFAYTSAVYDIERGQMSKICPLPWQTDTAIAKNSWGYTENNEYKRAEDIICDLIDIVSKNGCLLLNVGPKADGTIAEEEKTVLRNIGKWMRINGEGIYNSVFWKVYGEGPTKIPEGHFTDTSRDSYTSEDIRYTYKNGSVYAYLMKLPKSRKAVLKAFACPENSEDDFHVVQVKLLGSKNPVSFTRNKNGLLLHFPEAEDTEYPIGFQVMLD